MEASCVVMAMYMKGGKGFVLSSKFDEAESDGAGKSSVNAF
jgi:hypothetical protein